MPSEYADLSRVLGGEAGEFEVPLQELSLEVITYEWIAKTNKIPHLKRAIKLIEEDGNYFPELKRAVQKKLSELDPTIKEMELRKAPVDPETAAKEREELEGFFKEMDRKEKGLKGENKNSIFEETTNPKNEQDRQRKRQRAENAKNKGNEAMKSKDWAEAIQHYETAVSLDNKFHIAYGNLAQAYLELKKYKDAVQAAGKAVEIDPKFTKGYYRRSKANQAMGNFLEAAKDLKKILLIDEKDSSTKEELDRLKSKNLDAAQLAELEQSGLSSKPQATTQFKRLQIIEQEEEEEEMEESGHQANPPRPSNQTTSPSFLSNLKKVQSQKERATEIIKKAMFDEALAVLEQHQGFFLDEETKLQQVSEEHLKEYYTLKMALHANIALCYAQTDLPKKVVSYSNIVIEAYNQKRHAVGLEEQDSSILEKSLLRKALALEKCEKFRDAREAHFEVKRLNPGNLTAAHGINRCNEYLEEKQMVGFDSISNPPKHPQPKPDSKPAPKATKLVEDMSEKPAPEELGNKGAAKSKPQLLEPKFASQEKKTDSFTRINIEEISSTEHESKLDFVKLLQTYERIKEEGNDEFKKNEFQKAFEVFSKVIKLIEKNHPGLEKKTTSEEEQSVVKLLISLLSNRAMACVKLAKYYQGIEDSKRVIHLDPKNPKIYHRKYACEEAIAAELRTQRKKLKDPELAMDIIVKEKQFLDDCLGALSFVVKHTNEEQYNKKKEELLLWSQQLARETKDLREQIQKKKEAPAPSTRSAKIVEVSETQSTEPKKTESTEQPKKQPAQTEPAPFLSNKPIADLPSLNMDQITLKALEDIISNPVLPSNASKFEVDLKSFKSYYDKMWAYLQRFESADFLSKLYSKRDMEAAIASQLLGCFAFALEQDESLAEQVAGLVLSLKSTANSHLMFKFLDKKSKQLLNDMLLRLTKLNLGAETLLKIYTEFPQVDPKN